MTVKQLRAFLAVAQTLSFTQACERLHLSQPALSLAIKGLEDSLGGKLLIRSTRSVRLTPEGASLLPLAKHLLAQWDNTEERLRQRFTLQLGRLSVAAMPSFAGNLLPSALIKFRQQYPKINVTVHDVINEEVMDMVRSRQVEIGIAFAPEGTGSLNFTPLFEDRFVAVVSSSSPLAGSTSLSWQQLLAHDFMTLQRPSMVRRLLEQELGKRQMALPVAFESHQLATVGRMVAEGLGVSAVPSMCIRQMHELGAHCVPLEAPSIACRVGILTQEELSVAAHALRSVLLECIKTPSLLASS
ncbi:MULTISPECIES: LysR family transcriptional regulator [Halomonadaceae]|jgi:LysR family carnitine catabolism transcriptional activator|uniref:LysR family transcriptional regulator n=1 Tax=Vreelandella piezotolerans TaxID=2609667 RepID=A0ABQ6X9M4_9GAMM|nr:MULTISPECIES: LysR family transcriptional regulator [Halomonas]KAE8438160.1 LysR family transcriptional regulator [Halomonas piezotolerans]QJA24231.1 LysR family transcriptional regulator [Halomonas piezotolerans]BCB62391.1 transcriptional regulator [Halomonas sp. A020]